MTNLVYNTELNGVELYFDNKPEQSTIDSLKGNGFRWSGFKKCWYAKQSKNTIKEAEKYIGKVQEQTEQIMETTVKEEKKVNNKSSLWDSTRWINLEVNKELPTKEMATEIRKHVKSRFPQCKFSVTSDYTSIDFNIMSSPYEKDSTYLKSIKDYCTNLIKAYHYCTCYDPYADYGSSYNFYGAYAEISYEYTQTEQTEEIKKDMIDFDNKQAEFEKAEQERKEREYQEQEKKREEEHKQYLLQQQEEKKQIEIINNSIEIKELEEGKRYFILGSQFAKLNKNNTLNMYIEEVKKGEYDLENVKITREIHFANEEALNYFSNMLLNDFNFLQGEYTGGNWTDDARIQTMTDWYNMTKEERETVIWNLYGVAIYYDNKLQFIVNTEGFAYARYVGLVEDVKIKKDNPIKQYVNNEQLTELKDKAETLTDVSTEIIEEHDLTNTWNNEKWTEYKDLVKQQLKNYNFKLSKSIIQQLPEHMESLKVAMYKLLVEVDGIQEQFKNADLKQGQKLTMFYISDWGSISTNRITLDIVEYASYAQYDNAVKLTFTPQGKRTKYYNWWYKEVLIYDGWLELPESVLHEVTQTGSGTTITSAKYMSCDRKQYDEILEYFAGNGIKPIVNTYKPIF